jgi:subtilisin family serine protease
MGWHGTHVAGIIAAASDNGLDVAGIGWNLQIMPLKVLGDGAAEMLMIDIVEAIDYAIANGARVLNCSYGGEAGTPEEQTQEFAAFERLRQKRILAVCAAGNAGIDNDTSVNRTYPASHDLDNIISVASSGQQDNRLSSSNYGKTSVDLLAPGESILSTKACSDPCTTVEYALTHCTGIINPAKSGTSFAAPHVSGVAGLILSRRPGIGYSMVKTIILKNVDRLAAVSEELVSGGRLNAVAALSQVCLPGEVRGVEGIGLADAILALRIASGLATAAAVCRTADVNGDDRIGLAEAIHDLQRLADLRQ